MWATRLLPDAESRRHALGHERRVGQRRQLHQPHSVRVAVQQFCRDLERPPGLATAAGAGQGQDRRTGKELPDRRHFRPAADEARGLTRQVVGERLQRAQRLALHGRPRKNELEDPLRFLQVLQPVRAQIPQGRAVLERRPRAARGRLREEDLAAMPGGQQSRHTVQGRAEVILAPLLRRAGVQGHPHPQRSRLIP